LFNVRMILLHKWILAATPQGIPVQVQGCLVVL